MQQSGNVSSPIAAFADLQLGLKKISATIYSGCCDIILAVPSAVSPHFRNLPGETVTHRSCTFTCVLWIWLHGDLSWTLCFYWSIKLFYETIFSSIQCASLDLVHFFFPWNICLLKIYISFLYRKVKLNELSESLCLFHECSVYPSDTQTIFTELTKGVPQLVAQLYLLLHYI